MTDDYFAEPHHVLDVNNTKDVQWLVSTGAAWKSGPRTQQHIVDLIVGGEVQRNPETEPPEVKAFLDRAMPAPERPPIPQDEPQ